MRTYSRASSGRAIVPHAWWVTQQPEDDEDVAVDVGRAGRAGGRVVVDAGPLDVRPVPLRRRVVQGERQPLGPAQQRLDHPVSRESRRCVSAFLPAAATAV